MNHTPDLMKTASELKREFDESFAKPAEYEPVVRHKFLLVKVQDFPWAIRVTDIQAAMKSPRVAPIPGSNQTLLGIGLIRGNLVAIHSVSKALGLSANASASSWTILSKDNSVGFAFDEIQGYAVLTEDRIHRYETESGSLYSDGVIEAFDAKIPLLNVKTLYDSVVRR